MQTSTVTTFKIKKQLNLILGQQGFSLVEILVALVIMAAVFTLLPFNLTETSRDKVRQTLSKFQRATRFCQDEAILRNAIVRLRFDLDKEPMEFTVEYGPGANIVLPQSKDFSKLSIKEREEELKRLEKLDGQFNKVDKFKDSNEPLPEEIFIYGIGSSYYPNLVTTGSASIYFYPNGEKDSALILLTSPEELISFEIAPFEDKTIENYYTFTENDLVNLEYTLENKTKEMFEEWLKN